MSGHDIDPRLSAGTLLPPALPPYNGPRPDSVRAEAGSYPNSAQSSPYYHYPPPNTQTPSQVGALSAGSQSNQASPPNAYQIPADDEGSPGVANDGGDGEGANGDDSKRPRACEACRGLKVRCDQDPTHPEIPCKRCAKAGRQCVITQPTRKRQKKADSRVAELEKKLDALTAALHQQQHGNQFAGGAPAAPPANMMPGRDNSFAGQMSQSLSQQGYPEAPMPSAKRRRTDEPMEAPSYDGADMAINPHLSSNPAANTEMAESFKDIIDAWAPNKDLKHFLFHTTPEEFVNRINNMISPEQAAVVFNRYMTKLAPHLPAVPFPAGTTAEQVFKEKPILYVCILSAASFGILPPDTSKQLAREAVGAIADCVVRNGAKSLELIQAMQVIALWYKPPEKAEQTNFYQIIHMAAVMALDIGLGKRFNPAKARRGFGGPNANYVPGPHKTLPQDSDTLEARRAWLTCYYLCASASMVLRRPNLVRWTNYMKECIEVLESHPDAYPSDKLFCQHVKIQHICEDIGLQFLMDDNTATISITDPKVTYALNVLENQLKDWKENIPDECRGPGLQFFEHVTSLYLHEIALHFNHNIEDFRLPFTEESLKSVTNTSDTLTQNQMAALEACLKAAHGILDTMLAYEKDTIKSLPMLLFFVRCVYAIVILIKMHVAVCTPNSELGKMMRPEDLRVEHYIDQLIKLFGNVSPTEGDRSDVRPHPKILHILTILRNWFEKHKANVAGQQMGRVKSESSSRKPKQEKRGSQNQTPLHLLSQVATGNSNNDNVAAATDWTFSSPTVVDYARNAPLLHPDSRLPINQQAAAQIRQQQPTYQDNAGAYPPDQQFPGLVDPTNGDYGWGSGFEQAMDIALGGMDGLQGGGLDSWFMGDGVAPFGFPSDVNMPSGAGGW